MTTASGGVVLATMSTHLIRALPPPVLAAETAPEENFTLAVAMFVIGLIATATIIAFVVVMHRRTSAEPHGDVEQGG